MKLSNSYNLPETIVNAVGKQYKPKANRFSVSDLTTPPQIRYLKTKHWDELEEDVSDKLWMLLGSAVHYILEKGSPENALSEEKMEIKIGDVTFVGKPDLLHNDEISDWKICSVYSFLLGDKPEWEAQLNLYKFLFAQKGLNVSKLTIHAILRDWQKSKSLQDADYPKIPFMSVDIPIWDSARVATFINKAISDLSAEVPRECTPEEQWAKPTQYAVQDPKKKRALRVLDSFEDAEKWMKAQPDSAKLNIAQRLGSKARCEGYCPVSKHCEQYKREEGGGSIE